MSDGPWIDTHTGEMWSYRDRDRWGRATRSVRNDALWDALVAERSGFVDLCREWCAAAVADGWSIKPTYGDHEAVERAFTLERDGFKISGIARMDSGTGMPSAGIHIWGSDHLAIKPPLTYDWEAIKRGAATCSKCGANPIETERVGFAGRYCAPCATVERPKIETPGWAE